MLRPDCRLDTAESMGGEHPVLDGLNRPGIPRIIPESIKASQVKISTIDEEAQDLMKDRLKRKPLAAFSQKRAPMRKKCGYPGCLKVSGYQGESGATGQFVGSGLNSIDLGVFVIQLNHVHHMEVFFSTLEKRSAQV